MELSESVQRVLGAREIFGELFYEEFFRRCPEARPLFDGHDMKRQALVMTMTLQSVQQFHDGGYPAVERYVEHLGAVHRRRGIPLEMYPHFRAAMLEVLGRLLADEWDATLRTEWELALDGTIRTMLEGYEKRPGV